ncbi:MAG: metalloregulator ArsR/SmtB family transcription factor [Bacillota bacterium]|nr:metalloregulator ArsR/SmtB family transcription factor [Bacillota bacterium]
MEKSYAEYNKVSDILKALAHPVRLCIVQGLIESGEANVSNMQACLDTPQSTTSQHLQKLKAMGIVECRREGLEVYYWVSSPLAADLMKVIKMCEFKH